MGYCVVNVAGVMSRMSGHYGRKSGFTAPISYCNNASKGYRAYGDYHRGNRNDVAGCNTSASRHGDRNHGEAGCTTSTPRFKYGNGGVAGCDASAPRIRLHFPTCQHTPLRQRGHRLHHQYPSSKQSPPSPNWFPGHPLSHPWTRS